MERVRNREAPKHAAAIDHYHSVRLAMRERKSSDFCDRLIPPRRRLITPFGTSNTRIRSAKGLSAMGIDQRRLNADLSRDNLRRLMSELVSVAASLGSAAP